MKCRFSLTVFKALLAIGIAGGAFAGSSPDELAEQVTIRRDAYGVPHVLAETEEAAAFGYGYAAAEDHPHDIALIYLRSQGREAEIFGKDFAENDLIMKRLRVSESAQHIYDEAPPWWQRYLDAYAAGYNRYLAQHPEKFSEWAAPISGVDVVAHGHRTIIIGFCSNLGQIRRIGSNNAARVDDDQTRGSNMWAINKDRSESGKALLLGNPHLDWAEEMLFHEVHLTVPGQINMMGATLVGFPGPALGWNGHFGWSHTVNPHDCDDVYELTQNPENPLEYMYEGRGVPAESQEIAIKVKTEDGVQEHMETVFWTHYGPVVKQVGDKIYAYRSPNLQGTQMMLQWYLMAKSKNLAEFRRALDMQALPMFNIAYADVDGNCFYIFNGRFPDRPAGYNWSGVVPGGTKDSEWYGILPQSRLPQLLNPAGGYVQNSNSAPWYTNLEQIIDRTQYPAELSPNMNSLRTRHGLELIASEEKLSLNEIKQLKFSMKLLAADRVKDDLVKIARDQTVDGVDLNEAVAVLEAWDNTVSHDSVGSVLFGLFVDQYSDKARRAYAVDWDEQQPATTPRGLGDKEAAVSALAAAVKQMNEKFGKLDVVWGDVFRLRKGDVDVPIGGGGSDLGAFRIIDFHETEDGKYVADGGDSYVFAVEFTQPPTAYSVMAYSQSNDPESPHYADQAELFANNGFKRAWFTEEDIKAHTERAYRP
ncbi:MAG: penicillin acylase family protein [Candidatus Hydrogenedentales bacterium]